MTNYRVPFDVDVAGKGPETKQLEVTADSPDDARQKAQEMLAREYGDRARMTGEVCYMVSLLD
jgi:hypothetical protein